MITRHKFVRVRSNRVCYLDLLYTLSVLVLLCWVCGEEHMLSSGSRR